jgi:tetratricopeptide (TPR) repeat protein
MSSDTTNAADPFALDSLDEETELRALANALQFAEGFKLIFVRCNQPQQRKRLMESLHEKLPQLKAQEIHFSEPVTHLLDSLRENIKEPSPDAVFVSGLEYSLPTAADADKTSFIANLNASRNSFPQILSCPVVLWVPEYVLTAIVRGAPDFFSIRSGIYFFAAAPAETADSAHTLTAGSEWAVWSLSLTEKQERITAIESLLADYEALPANQRDSRLEMRLHSRLGNLLLVQGVLSSAQQHFEKTLQLAGELSNLEWKGYALNVLGNVYFLQGHIEEAKAACQGGLEIDRELGQRGNEAQALSNMGIIYSAQGQYKKAEESYKQSLQISQESGDREREAHALMGLGDVYFNQGELEEAEHTSQETMGIAREIRNYVIESYSLNRLGSIFFQQGRLEEASNMFQQSMEISRKIGHHAGEGGTLHNLALLRKSEGKVSEALEFARQSVTVWERTEGSESLEQARQLVRELEQQLQEQSNLVSTKK